MIKRYSDDFDSSATEIENIFNKLAKLYPNDKVSFVFFRFNYRYLLSCVLDADRYDSYLLKTTKGNKHDRRQLFAKPADELENHIRKLDKSGSVNKERQKILTHALALLKMITAYISCMFPLRGKTLKFSMPLIAQK